MATKYIEYELDENQIVKIPREEIERYMKLDGVKTEDDACWIWCEDNGKIINPEQEELDKKAKANRITATIHQARADYKPKTQRERVVKADPTKEGVIKAIAELLPSLNATEVKIENVGKLITFKLGADEFKIDLVRKRPPKEKK